LVDVVDPPHAAGLESSFATVSDEEDADDPKTVLLPDMGAIAAAAFDAEPSPPAEIAPEPTLSKGAPALPVPRRTVHDWLAGATMATGVAFVIALLVVVAIVGVVGGLGIGIAIANVAS